MTALLPGPSIDEMQERTEVSDMEQEEAKKEVIRTGKRLVQTGLVARTWGNVSCRLSEDTFGITASGRDYMTLTPKEVVAVKIDDLTYEGTVRPSSELRIHREIYRLKPEAGAVIHTHQNWASAVSAMGQKKADLGREYPGIGRYLQCAGYGLPGTEKLCRNTIEALKAAEGRALLLSSHGALCYGADLEEAFQTALVLEEACCRYLQDTDRELFSLKEGTDRQPDKGAIWDSSPILLRFAKEQKEMLPYLDDFAQMAGLQIKVLPEDKNAARQAVQRGETVLVKGAGAYCTAETREDAKALAMIIKKNAMAFFAAQKTGAGPIPKEECKKMRSMYLNSYSKLRD